MAAKKKIAAPASKKTSTAWKVLPEAYQKLALENQKHVLLLGYLRTHLKIVPPPEALKNSATLVEYLKELEHECVTPVPETVPVHVEIDQNVWGTEYYSSTRSAYGNVNVPVDIVRQGVDAINTWVRNNAGNQIGWNYDNFESGDAINEDTEESDFSSDAESVFEAYRREYS